MINLRIYALKATAFNKDNGKQFFLSLKIDSAGSNQATFKSDVVSSHAIEWLPEPRNPEVNIKEFNFEVSNRATLTFELTKRGRGGAFLPSAKKHVASFSIVVDKLRRSREKGKPEPHLEPTKLRAQCPESVRDQGGSRESEPELHWRELSFLWEVENLQDTPLDPDPDDSDDKHDDPRANEDASDPPVPRLPPSKIYSRLLLGLERGAALWTPGCPGKGIPRSYKRRGLGIGDVGIISPHDGAFQYHFNLFHKPGHEENPPDLPDNLLCQGVSPNILEYTQERETVENHVLGRVDSSSSGAHSPMIEYSICASEWAILAIPNGSKSEYMVNKRILTQYLESKGGDLYKYLLEKRGIDAENGDLCVVTGWTKTNSWGMAAFSDDNSPPRSCTLNFKPNAEDPRIPQNKWDCSQGFVSTKSGPGLQEIQNLREETEDETDAQERNNQCLFVKTISLTLRESLWNEMLQEIGDLPVDCDTKDGPTGGDISANATGPSDRNGNTIGFVTYNYNTTSPGQQRATLLPPLDDQRPSPWSDVRDSNPSQVIQKFLLSTSLKAKWSISDDMTWAPILKEKEAFLPNSEPRTQYILSRVLELNEICEEDGSVSLKPKDISIPNICVYVDSSCRGLQAKIQERTIYSQVVFVEKLEQADIWIVEKNGEYYGRFLPLFRLLLQLGGILEIYVGLSSLMKLEFLENPCSSVFMGMDILMAQSSRYSLSKNGCCIGDTAIRSNTFQPMEFGIKAGQPASALSILPLGREAADILSLHFAALSATPPSCASTEVPEVPSVSPPRQKEITDKLVDQPQSNTRLETAVIDPGYAQDFVRIHPELPGRVVDPSCYACRGQRRKYSSTPTWSRPYFNKINNSRIGSLPEKFMPRRADGFGLGRDDYVAPHLTPLASDEPDCFCQFQLENRVPPSFSDVQVDDKPGLAEDEFKQKSGDRLVGDAFTVREPFTAHEKEAPLFWSRPYINKISNSGIGSLPEKFMPRRADGFGLGRDDYVAPHPTPLASNDVCQFQLENGVSPCFPDVQGDDKPGLVEDEFKQKSGDLQVGDPFTVREPFTTHETEAPFTAVEHSDGKDGPISSSLCQWDEDQPIPPSYDHSTYLNRIFGQMKVTPPWSRPYINKISNSRIGSLPNKFMPRRADGFGLGQDEYVAPHLTPLASDEPCQFQLENWVPPRFPDVQGDDKPGLVEDEFKQKSGDLQVGDPFTVREPFTTHETEAPFTAVEHSDGKDGPILSSLCQWDEDQPIPPSYDHSTYSNRIFGQMTVRNFGMKLPN